MLVDVRFKYFSPKLRSIFACLGLVVTRNSQLHDDLISRGRKIEDELGVDTGVFRGRKVAKGVIKHDHATFLIYGAALIAWLAAIWTSACAL
jgi:hypothetical protein